MDKEFQFMVMPEDDDALDREDAATGSDSRYAVQDMPESREAGHGHDNTVTDEMYTVAATVGHIADQLNVLLEDINNITIESENSVISNLSIVNDNIKRLRDAMAAFDAETLALLQASAADRAALLAGVNSLRAGGIANVEDGGNVVHVNSGVTSCEIQALRAEVAELKASLSAQSEANRGLIVDEIRRFRDHMLIISMAKVTDGEEESYETYNEILLSEIKSLKDELGTIDPDALAAAVQNMPVVEYRPAAPVAAPQPAATPKAAPKPKKPPVKRPAPVQPKKVVSPVIGSDLSINEILSKIGSTDAKVQKD